MAPRNRRDTLKKFTDRAVRATDLGQLIPPIVYLPQKLRAHGLRLTVDNLRLTVTPPTVAENHIRIAEADPLGFLIAIMNGQPIPSFQIQKEGSVRVIYEVAEVPFRTEIAKFLAGKVTLRTTLENKGGDHVTNNGVIKDPLTWDAMVEARNQRVRDNPEMARTQLLGKGFPEGRPRGRPPASHIVEAPDASDND